MWPFVLALISSTRLGGRKDTLYSEIKAHVLPFSKRIQDIQQTQTHPTHTHTKCSNHGIWSQVSVSGKMLFQLNYLPDYGLENHQPAIQLP